jgi:hypothetical protein
VLMSDVRRSALGTCPRARGLGLMDRL